MEITANAVQEVAAANNVIFTDTAVQGNSSMVHREGSGLVKLRGLTTCQQRARFKIFFSANIALPTGGTAGPISLAISVDGEPVATTTMTVTPAAVEEFFNVYSSIFIDVPRGCCNSISIRNISNIPINVQNANLIIERVA